MMSLPDFDVKKWCVYNEKKKELELKKDAPEEIQKKFQDWQEEMLKMRYKI